MLKLIEINSINDPRIEPYRDVRDRDLRGRDNLFMAESELVVRRLLRTPERLHSLLLSPSKFERMRDEIERTELAAPVYLADVDLMTQIAGFHIHRGVLAAGLRPRKHETTLVHALGHLRNRATLTLLIAEGITNVDNMGGLFRNAAAFGVDGVLLDPTCCDPLYRKAIRVSVGHTLLIPWAISQDWPHDLRALREQWNLTLIAAETTHEAMPLWEIPRDDRTAIVLGAEADGLSQAALEHVNLVAHVPMAEGVPSLNVAACAAVFLYELKRKRRPNV